MSILRHTSLILAGVFLIFCMAGQGQASVPVGDRIVFEIFRNGSSFGTHTLDFSRDSQGRTVVEINIEMKYTLGPVTLFRYEHYNREVWQGGKILSVESRTNDDGDIYNVRAIWGKDYVDVQESSLAPYDAPASVFSTSYWNESVLKTGDILNTQKGTIEPITVKSAGVEDFTTKVETLKGRAYNVQADVPLTLWYDSDTGEWIGLKFSLRGSDIEYRRVNRVGGKAL